jgi:hypothetical protein
MMCQLISQIITAPFTRHDLTKSEMKINITYSQEHVQYRWPRSSGHY